MSQPALKERSLLIVSHISPFPPRAGVQVRIAQTLEWLKAEGFEVTYVFQPIDPPEPPALEQLRASVHELIVVRQYGTWETAKRFARGWLAKAIQYALPPLYERLRAKPQPSQNALGPQYGDLEALCWPATLVATRKALESLKPKFVLSEFGCFAKCLELAPSGSIRLLDTHELYSVNHEQFASAGVRDGFRCTAENEQKALRKADVLIAIQRNDQRLLASWFPEKKIILMPCTYDVKAAEKAPALSPQDTVLYVGAANHFNTHGLRRFLEEVWPLVLRAHPTARFRVAGNIARPDYPAPGTEFLGRISEEALAEEYRSAAVVINPQLAGTGLKIKCVEALGRGAALVTYPAGADGLEEGSGEAFLLAKSAQEFAAHIVTLLEDPARRARMQAEARRYAERNFSPQAAFRELSSVLSAP